MDTLQEKTERTKLYIEFGILIISLIGFLSDIISFKTFLVILLSLIIIAVIILRNWNYPKYKDDNKPFWSFCKKSKSVLVSATIIIALISLLINIGQHNFPKYQNDFMASHFTTPKELDELKPLKVNVVDIRENKSISINQPKIIISNDNQNYIFESSKLTEEMLKYSSQNFNSYGFGFIFLAFVLLFLFIVADFFIVSISKKPKENEE